MLGEINGENLVRLTDIARMAMGGDEAGKAVGKTVSGGAGRIGLFKGRVIKFDTHYGERRSEGVSDEMRRACNDLRRELVRIAAETYGAQTDDTVEISAAKQDRYLQLRAKLGLAATGEPSADLRLLDRKIVAQVINQLAADSGTDVWGGARAGVRSSAGRDTTFAALTDRIRAEIEAERRLVGSRRDAVERAFDAQCEAARDVRCEGLDLEWAPEGMRAGLRAVLANRVLGDIKARMSDEKTARLGLCVDRGYTDAVPDSPYGFGGEPTTAETRFGLILSVLEDPETGPLLSTRLADPQVLDRLLTRDSSEAFSALLADFRREAQDLLALCARPAEAGAGPDVEAALRWMAEFATFKETPAAGRPYSRAQMAEFIRLASSLQPKVAALLARVRAGGSAFRLTSADVADLMVTDYLHNETEGMDGLLLDALRFATRVGVQDPADRERLRQATCATAVQDLLDQFAAEVRVAGFTEEVCDAYCTVAADAGSRAGLKGALSRNGLRPEDVSGHAAAARALMEKGACIRNLLKAFRPDVHRPPEGLSPDILRADQAWEMEFSSPFGFMGQLQIAGACVLRLKDLLDTHPLSEALRPLGERTLRALTREKGGDDLRAALDFARLDPALAAYETPFTACAERSRQALTAAYDLTAGDLAADRAAAERTVRTAVEALVDYAESLRGLANRLPDPPDALYALIDYANARAAEVAHAFTSVAEGLERIDGHVTVRELAAERMLEMHGSRDFAVLFESKADALKTRLLVALTDPAGQVDFVELARIETELRTLEDELKRATGPGGALFERSLRDAFVGTVEGLRARFAMLCHVRTRETALHAVQDFFDVQTGRLKPKNPLAARCEAYRDLTAACISEDGAFDAVRFARTVRQPMDRELFPRFLSAGLRTPLAALGDVLEQVCGRRRTSARMDHALVGRLLNGEIGLQTLVGATVHGFRASDVDYRTDDRYLVQSKVLGSGAVNTVQRLTYQLPDGQRIVRVFKPEVPAITGLRDLVAGFIGYAPTNSAGEISRATRRAAAFLGTPGRTSGVTVGVHDGQFGFFMEVADGQEAGRLDETDFANTDLSPASMGGKSVDDQLRVLGRTMRGTCELAWMDWLTGQSDRHWLNYLVDPDTGDVTGIDNDAAFSSARTGLRTFRVLASDLDRLLATTSCRTVDQFRRRFTADSLRPLPDGAFLFDAGVHPRLSAVAREMFGIQTLALPTRISETTYRRLMEVRDSGSYADVARDILGDTFSQAQLDATVSRLREMTVHAETLARRNGVGGVRTVLADADWDEPRQIRSALREQIATRDQALRQIEQARLQPKRGRVHLLFACEIFLRDFEDVFFAGVPLSRYDARQFDAVR